MYYVKCTCIIMLNKTQQSPYSKHGISSTLTLTNVLFCNPQCFPRYT